MIRRSLALFAVVGATALLALPASADGAGAVSFTQVFHNFTQVSLPGPPMGVNPCTGAFGTLTITYDGAAHATFLTSGVGAGTGWVTFTGTGSFTFAQLDGVVYTGHFTAWDGASFNLENFTGTGILVGHGTGSDGSTLDFHAVMHITVLEGNPPSVVVSFNNLTCG